MFVARSQIKGALFVTYWSIFNMQLQFFSFWVSIKFGNISDYGQEQTFCMIDNDAFYQIYLADTFDRIAVHRTVLRWLMDMRFSDCRRC